MFIPQDKKVSNYSIAFYNLENLFDPKDDPNKLDDDFTPNSDKTWNTDRFNKKVKDLGRVIPQIGYNDTTQPPVLVGLAEVENCFVLKQLINSKFMKDKGYDFVHFDSPDERGIDTALLYRKEFFKVIKKEAITLFISNEFGVRDFTRDILYVHGTIEEEEIHILVNHWPSRRSGTEETEGNRIVAAEKNIDIISKIVNNNQKSKIIVMGDFNDDPHSKSVKKLIGTNLYNPMELLHTQYSGTINYKGGWNLFDQIILSNNFLQQHENTFRFEEAKIFNAKSLSVLNGKNKGNPFRTFVGNKYIGGVSDHFPVYGIFSISSKN